MKRLKYTIHDIKLDGYKNLYALGLNLKSGFVDGYKFYNKIYDHSEEYYDLLEKFGGQNCLNWYLNTNEWKNYYPGFSGFTLGIEAYARDNFEYRCGYGFKDKKDGILKFNAFYIDKNKTIIERETYKYIFWAERKDIKNALDAKYFEIKENDEKNYSFCPKINYNKIPLLEEKIRKFLTDENTKIFDKIKELDENFYIVNCGENKNSQKIYLINRNNKDLNLLINLVEKLVKNS